MKMFKTKKGSKASVYEINRTEFEKKTKLREPYVQTGKDLKRRQFAICPACDNPIQMVNLYKKEGVCKIPYAKHYNRGVDGLASHNQQAYWLCPYSSRQWIAPSKNEKKKEVTDFEREIFRTVRDNFDYIIYVLKQDTNLYFSYTSAYNMLANYVTASGWMYEWATIYNIPWMVLYLSGGFSLYGRLIVKDTKLYDWTVDDKNIVLEPYKKSNYVQVKTSSYADISFMLHDHKRVIKNGFLNESISAEISKKVPGSDWETVMGKKIKINESRFVNLINSEEAKKHRNKEYLDIAQRIMCFDL